MVFPKWTNRVPAILVASLGVLACFVVFAFWYWGSPKHYVVGYQPVQPVAYSHKLHAGQLGLDCRYCHSAVEKSWFSNIPSGNTCMNCHNQVAKESPKLALVRDSYNAGQPIPWVQIHMTPDYRSEEHTSEL